MSLAVCYFTFLVIVGTGIDIVEVPRIAAAVERFGERFLNRVFTASEIRYCQSKQNAMERFAARFAAKEAGFKAIGTGWRHGVTWQDVEVGREPGGRPSICYSGKAAEFAAKLGVRRASLSLSHTAEQAIAQVILED
jgi:holo-[acyl-carrier protein] synthase